MLSSGQLDLAEPVEVGIEVQVDTRGRADIGTLRLSGAVSGTARDAITRWIEDSRFESARRDGVPVTGVYRTRISSRLEARPRRD